MAQRTSLDRGAALAAIAKLCAGGLTGEALRRELRPRLRRLLPFAAYCINACDPSSGLITSSVGDGLNPEDARRLFAIEAEGQDFNRLSELAQGREATRALGLATGGDLARSQRMREIFLPLGYGDELRSALLLGGACFGYAHLFRRLGEPGFDTNDVAAVAAAAPSIAAGLRAALLRPASESAAPASGLGLLRLDREDQVLEQSPGAERALASLDTTRSGLSHVARVVASHARRGAPARAIVSGDGRTPFRVSALTVGERTTVVVDELTLRDAQALALSAAGLSARERDVCGLLLEGCSNQILAENLGVTLHTAKDHVKAVLRKTGSRTRAELVARVRGGKLGE